MMLWRPCSGSCSRRNNARCWPAPGIERRTIVVQSVILIAAPYRKIRTTMSTEIEWEFVGAVPDGESFEIDGLDVWRQNWRPTTERAAVRDPLYHQDFNFDVYEIGSPGNIVRF